MSATGARAFKRDEHISRVIRLFDFVHSTNRVNLVAKFVASERDKAEDSRAHLSVHLIVLDHKKLAKCKCLQVSTSERIFFEVRKQEEEAR